MSMKLPLSRYTFIKTRLSIILIVSALLVSCGSSNVQEDTILPTINEAYPVQNDNSIIQDDNIKASASYPAASTPTGTLLALSKPIKSSDTEVSGVGPSGLPISIINITLMGEKLGSGVIGSDGSFSIPVSLQSNIRIGISADIETFGLTLVDIRPGDEAMNVPLVGYFFDTTVVVQDGVATLNHD